MTCRTCALWDVDAAKDGAGRIRKDRVARCLWVSTEIYPLSLSYSSDTPEAGWMSADQGHGCPLHKERGKRELGRIAKQRRAA